MLEINLGNFTILPRQERASHSLLLSPAPILLWKALRIRFPGCWGLVLSLIVRQSDLPWLMHGLLLAKCLCTTPGSSCLPLTCFAWPGFLNWNSVAGSFGTRMFAGAHPKAIIVEIIPPWLSAALCFPKYSFSLEPQLIQLEQVPLSPFHK